MRFTLMCCTALVPLALHAAPATEDGADAIEAAIARYLPPVPGLVDVTPQGESYALTVDLAPLAAMIPPGMAEVTIAPSMMELTDLGDGLWQVTHGSPGLLSVSVPGMAEVSVEVPVTAGSGVYDTSILAFRDYEFSGEGLTMSQKITDPNTGEDMDFQGSVGSFQLTSSASAADGGGVDVRQSFSLADYDVATRQSTPGFDIAYTATIARAVGDISVDGAQSGGMLDLIAHLFAQPSPMAIMADQDALKDRLRGALPLFGNIVADGRYEDVVVDVEGFGQVTADALGLDVEMAGVVNEGKLRERLSLEGVTLPDGVLPPWALPMVPSAAAINFELSGYDLASPAEMFLDQVNFMTGPDPAFSMAALQALLKDGALTISLLPEQITGDGFALDYEGTVDVDPLQEKVNGGSGRIVAHGMDRFLELAGGTPEQVQGGLVPGLMMARGMAQAGDGDSLIWEIEFTPDQKLMVNGQDLSPLLGMQ